MIIVFGGTGFVGTNLVHRLANDGREVVSVSRSGAPLPGAIRSISISELDDLGPLPSDTVVCHVAAQRYDASSFVMAQSDILTANVELTNRIYAFCARRKIKEIRLASSVAVYEAGLSIMDDDRAVDLNAPPHAGEAMYAWSKRWAEITASLYAQKYGIATVIFRLSNPYGPFDSTDQKTAHVLPAFVIRALDQEGPFLVKGDPYVERDFIFVDDVTNAFSRSLEWLGREEVYNLCRGETDTLLHLAREIIAITGKDRPVVTETTYAPAAVSVRRATSVRIRAALGIQEFTSLSRGLEATISWYRKAGRA